MEALVYKGLLLRLQANLEKDPAKQQQLLKDAEQLRDKAKELRKKKAGRHRDLDQQPRTVQRLDPRPPGAPGGLSFCTVVTAPQGKISWSLRINPFRQGVRT